MQTRSFAKFARAMSFAVAALTALGAAAGAYATERDRPIVIPKTGERCLDRGSEFLSFRDGLICEVRAYYSRDGDLIGFDRDTPALRAFLEVEQAVRVGHAGPVAH